MVGHPTCLDRRQAIPHPPPPLLPPPSTFHLYRRCRRRLQQCSRRHLLHPTLAARPLSLLHSSRRRTTKTTMPTFRRRTRRLSCSARHHRPHKLPLRQPQHPTTSTRLSSASKSRLRRLSTAARLDPLANRIVCHVSHTTRLLRHRRSYRRAPRAAHDSRRRLWRLSLYRPVPSSLSNSKRQLVVEVEVVATLTRITPTYT